MDQDIPSAQQISLEELDQIDQSIGVGIVELASHPDYCFEEGRQADPDQHLEYEYTMRVVVALDRSTGRRYALNYTRFAKDHMVEFHEGVSIENGVMGLRFQAARGVLAKLGRWSAFLEPILLSGGSVPALLKNAAVTYLKTKVVKPGGLLEQLLGRSK